jgi:hypothetical protein
MAARRSQTVHSGGQAKDPFLRAQLGRHARRGVTKSLRRGTKPEFLAPLPFLNFSSRDARSKINQLCWSELNYDKASEA